MLRSIALLCSAEAAIHCNNLVDYKCYSINGFCLNHLQRACEVGTVCDEDFRRHHPTQSPCVLETNSYGCNPHNNTCEASFGIQTFGECKKGCKPAEYKCDHSTHKCEKVASGGESHSACTKACAPPPPKYICNHTHYTCDKSVSTHAESEAECHKTCVKPKAKEYKCDHTDYKCVETTTGGHALASCEHSCVKPKAKEYKCDHTDYKCVETTTGGAALASCEHSCVKPTPKDCTKITDWNCENSHGFCLAHTYKHCEVGTLCSETFHKHNPTESPCINPDQSYGCNKETHQCVERTGYLNKTTCASHCH